MMKLRYVSILFFSLLIVMGNGTLNAENIALGKSYLIGPKAIWGSPSEKGKELTDGSYEGRIGWRATDETRLPVWVTIDLGSISPIDKVSIGAGVEGEWAEVLLAVSDDGKKYYGIKRKAIPANDKYKLDLTSLKTKGRYVLVILLRNSYNLFLDEIEVIKGEHSLKEVSFSEEPFNIKNLNLVLKARRELLRIGNNLSLLNKRLINVPVSKRKGEIKKDIDNFSSNLRELNKKVIPDPNRVKDLNSSLSTLNAGIGKLLFPGQKLLIWVKSPWASIFSLDLPTTNIETLPELKVYMGIGEYESTAFNLTNITDKDIVLRIKPIRLKDAISMREVVYVEANSNARIGKIVGDALPLLKEEKIKVPAGETKQIWVTVNSKNLSPGNYKTKIKIEDGGVSGDVEQIPLYLKVYPVNFPEVFSLNTYNYAYLYGGTALTAGAEKEAIEDLLSHHQNTFVFTSGSIPRPSCDKEGNLTKPLDFSRHNWVIKQHKGANTYGWFWCWGGKNSLSGLEFMTPAWKKCFRTWITQWVAHLKELGIGHDRFFFYISDESACWTESFVSVTAYVKEIDPRIRIVAVPILKATMTIEKIERISPYIDIWQIYLPLAERKPEILQILKNTEKTSYTYCCWGPGKLLNPYGYYRMMSWKAWNFGFTGAACWAYADNNSPGNAWDDYDFAQHESCFAVVYAAKNAPPDVSREEKIITSKRWEAWREGIEDYECLKMLQDKIKLLKSKGKASSGLIRAEGILKEAPKKILSEKAPQRVYSSHESQMIDSIHRSLLEAIASLPEVNE